MDYRTTYRATLGLLLGAPLLAGGLPLRQAAGSSRLPSTSHRASTPVELRQPAGRLGSRQKWAFIDLRRRPQTVACYEGLKVVALYPCSGSRFGTSDRGWAVVGNRRRQARYAGSADSPAYWMQWWVGIHPDTESGRRWARARGLNGFHASPLQGLARLGRPASHGCIRLEAGDARQFWKWAESDMPLYFSVLRPADPERLLIELRRRTPRPAASRSASL